MDAHQTFQDLSKVSTYRSGVVQSRAHRALKKKVAAFLQPHGITMMEWFIVGFIYDAGEAGIRVTELAKHLQTTLPYLTNSINTLVLKNFVVREDSEDDNRAKRIKLTDDARRRCPDIESDLRVKMRRHIYGRLDPDDLRVYIKVLHQLAD